MRQIAQHPVLNYVTDIAQHKGQLGFSVFGQMGIGFIGFGQRRHYHESDCASGNFDE